ncbi:Thymus-specific serine protease, partial [Ascosphaera atra]
MPKSGTNIALGASLAAPSLAQPPPNAHVAEANFTQLIDHRDPSKGTFPQRYWYSSEHWAGPGAPVVITTPGEQSAETFWTFATNKSLTGVMAQNVRGATVVLEHRYWGESLPFDQLTEESFKYLTIENAIQDFVHFAKTVQLPFDKNHSSNAQHAPWVLSGGSYSGSLAAYTARKEPGTFWAYHATSAPVQAIYNFWQFLEPIMEGMPQNCSSDLNAMWNYVDGLYFSGKHDE